MAKDHRDSTDNLNDDDSIEAQPGPVTNLTEALAVEPTVENPDLPPRQQKRAAKRALCKFIFMNLRTTVTLQEETGYTIDYATDRFFPAPIEPLIAAA